MRELTFEQEKAAIGLVRFERKRWKQYSSHGKLAKASRKAKEEEPLLAHERAPGTPAGRTGHHGCIPAVDVPSQDIPFAQGPGLPERASSPPAIP
jgi:hypothetical protein